MKDIKILLYKKLFNRKIFNFRKYELFCKSINIYLFLNI